jgi:hypothetical protein
VGEVSSLFASNSVKNRGWDGFSRLFGEQKYVNEKENYHSDMLTEPRHSQARGAAAILTALAIAGQCLLLLKNAYQAIMYAEFYSILNTPSPFSDWYVVLTFVFLTPLYCMFVPHLSFLAPYALKRRLNPLMIQIATFVFYVLLTVFSVLQSAFARVIVYPYSNATTTVYHFTGPVTFYAHPISALSYVIVPFFLELLVLGIAERSVVFRVVGLIPPERPPDQRTYRVNISEDSLTEVIKNASIDGLVSVSDTPCFAINRQGGKHLILSTSRITPETAFVSTVPYQETPDSLVSTPETSELRNSVINDLGVRIQNHVNARRRRGQRAQNVRFVEVTGPLGDHASTEAMNLALKDTHSKINVLVDTWRRDVPSFHRAIMILCVLALIVNLGLYFFKVVQDLNIVVSTAVFVFVVLLLDLGIPLREEMQRRRRRRGT